MSVRPFAAAAAALFIAALPLPAQPQATPALPGWMAGCWVETKGEAWTEECWTIARAGLMLGSGRSGQGDRLGTWEVMQIIAAPDSSIAFFAAPGGVGRTRFVRASGGADEVIFINADNDYPQRIRYWREGGALNAEIALQDGSKPMRWSFKRTG